MAMKVITSLRRKLSSAGWKETARVLTS